MSSDLIAQWKSLITSTANTSDNKTSTPDLKRKREENDIDGKDVKRRANENEGVVKLNASGTVVKNEVKNEVKNDEKPLKQEPIPEPINDYLTIGH